MNAVFVLNHRELKSERKSVQFYSGDIEEFVKKSLSVVGGSQFGGLANRLADKNFENNEDEETEVPQRQKIERIEEPDYQYNMSQPDDIGTVTYRNRVRERYGIDSQLNSNFESEFAKYLALCG